MYDEVRLIQISDSELREKDDNDVVWKKGNSRLNVKLSQFNIIETYSVQDIKSSVDGEDKTVKPVSGKNIVIEAIGCAENANDTYGDEIDYDKKDTDIVLSKLFDSDSELECTIHPYGIEVNGYSNGEYSIATMDSYFNFYLSPERFNDIVESIRKNYAKNIIFELSYVAYFHVDGHKVSEKLISKEEEKYTYYAYVSEFEIHSNTMCDNENKISKEILQNEYDNNGRHQAEMKQMHINQGVTIISTVVIVVTIVVCNLFC